MVPAPCHEDTPLKAPLLRSGAGSWARVPVSRSPGHSPDRSPFAKVAVRQGSVGVWGRGPRLQHYGAAGDVNGHAGVLDEEILQGAALEAGGPESGPLCSKTGGRGNKPALVHQGGRGRGAACWGRGGPGAGWSRVAVYGAREGEPCGGGGAAGRDTHAHRTQWGGERKGIVSQTRSPARRAHRAPTGRESRPAALGHVRCGPQRCAARRWPRLCVGWGPVTRPSVSLPQPHLPSGPGELPSPLAAPSPSAALPPALSQVRESESWPPTQASPGRSMMSQPSTSSSSETKARGHSGSSGVGGVLKKRLVRRWNMAGDETASGGRPTAV